MPRIPSLLPAIYLVSFLLTSCGGPSKEKQSDPPTLFHLLPPEKTGVTFSNKLSEGLNTNILMYEYFYNGAGVAAGDFNGDKLIDLYFTSNMEKNKLYLNEGGLKFRDISLASGTEGRPGPWKTGVSTVDINGDNLLDLYVSYSGMLPDRKRANQLFINQGNDDENTPRFIDEAEKYGLASTGFTNQAYFFDYDQDGDLDVLLLNHNPKSLPILNEVRTAEFLKQPDPQKGVRLYQQSLGHFRDITEEAGISGSALSYGLGVGITDINNDGWMDFYVSNDYAVPDYLYINNRNGTFSNKLEDCLGHNSHFSMGNDIADINNDGWQDIVTLDMLPEDNRRQKLLLSPDNYSKFDLNLRSGFYYQYMRNMLQLNNGNGTLSEVGQMAGISNTDWSWAALLADYNNDGWKDLYITNGYLRDYTNLDFIKYMDGYVQKKGRLVREDVLELISNMPSSNVVNYLFINENGLKFANIAEKWGTNQPSNSNGAAYADLDNDGDLDLIVSNINQPAFIYENKTNSLHKNNYLQIELKGQNLNTQGIGAIVTVYSKGDIKKLEQVTSRGYLSATSPILHFGLGDAKEIDSLTVRWDSKNYQVLKNMELNQRITLDINNAGQTSIKTPESKKIFKEVQPPINHQNIASEVRDFDRQPLLITELSHTASPIEKADFNRDGIEDLFIGGGASQPAKVYLQNKNGTFTLKESKAFYEDQSAIDYQISIIDVNGDHYPDIYVASGGYHDLTAQDPLLQDRLYINDGLGTFTRKTMSLPTMLTSKGCVTASDVNNDGFTDLFVGSRCIPGRYPETPKSYLLINDGKGRFTNSISAFAPELEDIGMVTDARWVDLNEDGREDLIVAGDWMPVCIFINKNGLLVNKTSDFLDNEYTGWWNTIATGNFNGDGKPDFIVGNTGQNTQFKVSTTEPAELLYHDFDQNGSVDPIFSFYLQGKSYPYVTRDELLRQLSYLRSKFTSYESYADATLTDIFTDDQLHQADRLEVRYTKTTLFLSTDEGTYKTAPLPDEVQYSPVHTIVSLDYNQDGNEDLILCGNDSHVKLRLGKYDANYGLLLKGDRSGNFTYLPQSHSGFDLKGDVRSALMLNDQLIFSLIDQTIVGYQLNRKKSD